ncbi:Hypothetical predicted protein, partial [Lynx pardinus]
MPGSRRPKEGVLPSQIVPWNLYRWPWDHQGGSADRGWGTRPGGAPGCGKGPLPTPSARALECADHSPSLIPAQGPTGPAGGRSGQPGEAGPGWGAQAQPPEDP